MAIIEPSHNSQNIIGGTGVSVINTSPTTTLIELQLNHNSEFVRAISRIYELERKLNMLMPHLELHDKYPAVKEAYEAYRITLKLVGYDNESK